MPLAIVFSVCFRVSSSSFACLQLHPELHMVLWPVSIVAAVMAGRGMQVIFEHTIRAPCAARCPSKDQLVSHHASRSG